MSTSTRSAGVVAALAGVSLRLGGIALLGIAAVQVWQVFARYVLNDSPSWAEPWTMTLLSAAMSFSAASAVHAGAHFSFPLLVGACPPRLQRVLQALGHGVVLTIGALLSVGAWRLFADSLSVPMAGAALPESAPYLPLCLGGGLMALFALDHLRGLLRAERE